MVFVILEQGFVCAELCNVVVSVNLSDVSVLMSEHAAAAVVANLFSVEGSAIFGSQFVVHSGCCSGRF